MTRLATLSKEHPKTWPTPAETASTHFTAEEPPLPTYKSRRAGALLGLVIAAMGYVPLIAKFWATRLHIRSFQGVPFDEDAWPVAVLSAGLFVGSLGILLFLKASFGSWTWKIK
jgi:hypothetical protein